MLSTVQQEEPRRGMRIAGQMSVGLLAKGAFDVLETMTSGRHLSADELGHAVNAIRGSADRAFR